MGERGLDEALDVPASRPGAVRRNATSADSTFGRGRKTSRETGWKPGALGRELDRAPRRRRRPSSPATAKKRSATSRCTITHQAVELGRAIEALDDERRGDVVRQVRDELVRRRLERGEVEVQDVAPVERRCSGCSRSSGSSAPVDLDGVDVRDPVGEEAREDAEARADLEHDVVGLELGEPPDHAEDVVVDQEVLAERLLAGRRSQAEDGASRSRRSAPPSSAGSIAARLGEVGEGVHDVGGLVAAAANRLRREVRAVGLGQDAGRPARAAPRRAARGAFV